MSISSDDVVARLSSFIMQRQQIPANDAGFQPDADLFDAGYLDSVGMVELVAYIESTFSITLEDHHLFSEDFTSLNGIARIIGQCRQA